MPAIARENELDAAVLRPDAPAPMRPKRRKVLAAAALGIVLAGAGAGAWSFLVKPSAPAYAAEEVQRGTIRKTISATGRLQAVTTVQVGTQVSGTVAELHADFNQQVKAGQLIARLDPSQFEAQVNQVQAAYSSALARAQAAQTGVASADGAVAAAEANVQRAEATRLEAERNAATTEQLVAEGVAARRTLETAQGQFGEAAASKQQAIAQLNQAKAQALSARSQIAQAQAETAQAKASVDNARVNLDRTYIRAPIDGVVVARNVDVGQTVAASLQAPILFLIANDLTRMQVLADIDEADVGQLGQDSKVTFTVDAFPADTFRGRISQIRLSPQTVQNVVTYTAVIDVANPELKLKPGMTANVTAITAERNDVVVAPNTALRFRPEGAAPADQKKSGQRPNGGTARLGNGAVLWKIAGEKLEPARVKLGISDGSHTEVLEGLQPGDHIAVPVVQAQQAPGAPKGSMFPMGGARGGRR